MRTKKRQGAREKKRGVTSSGAFRAPFFGLSRVGGKRKVGGVRRGKPTHQSPFLRGSRHHGGETGKMPGRKLGVLCHPTYCRFGKTREKDKIGLTRERNGRKKKKFVKAGGVL